MKRKSLLIAVTVVILIGGALILHLTSILKPKNELKIGKPLV